mmetsp:Transcript_18432/g.55581  ORF Transcript_18432/g.55581 Transcript_18432/m.55581 type:complete len:235 (-) Transcript_18432:863-1567(-)
MKGSAARRDMHIGIFTLSPSLAQKPCWVSAGKSQRRYDWVERAWADILSCLFTVSLVRLAFAIPLPVLQPLDTSHLHVDSNSSTITPAHRASVPCSLRAVPASAHVPASRVHGIGFHCQAHAARIRHIRSLTGGSLPVRSLGCGHLPRCPRRRYASVCCHHPRFQAPAAEECEAGRGGLPGDETHPYRATTNGCPLRQLRIHAQVVDDLLQGLVADEEGAALGRPPDDSHPIAK